MVALNKNSSNKNYKPYYPFSNYPDIIMSNNTLSDKPSNCQELQHLGHKLSGFYLVKGINDESNDVVYCNFTQKEPGTFFSKLKESEKLIYYIRFIFLKTQLIT